MYKRPPLSEIDQEFNDLTKHFDLEVKNYQDHPKDGCTGQQLNIKGY